MSKEDFISKLKKMKSDSKSPSVIAETLEKIEALEKQNEELKRKIDKNVGLVHSSEEILEQTIGEKDNLREDLANNKKYILDLENNMKLLESKIKTLTEENESLNKQLAEAKEKYTDDYIIPVEESVKPESTSESSKTLEILVQDLQADLNKYKKAVVKLKNEIAELKETQKIGDPSGMSKKITELKKENEMLKNEISKLKETLEKKATEAFEVQATDSMIKELQEELKEREEVIRELKTTKAAEATIPSSGPMSGLIEDLQGKINKLKLALKEKNKKIDELQKK